MYEIGHSEFPSAGELLGALRRLEAALHDQVSLLRVADELAEVDDGRAALRQSVGLMRGEGNRLRNLLGLT